MRRAFHSIHPPKNFALEVIDNEFFLTLRINEKMFMSLAHDQKIEGLQYVMKVKKALEDNGAVVMVVRNAVKDE